jgi:hypothetical protein
MFFGPGGLEKDSDSLKVRLEVTTHSGTKIKGPGVIHRLAPRIAETSSLTPEANNLLEDIVGGRKTATR